MPGPGPHAYEQDILEEDLDDSPYTPYSYPKKAKANKSSPDKLAPKPGIRKKVTV